MYFSPTCGCAIWRTRSPVAVVGMGAAISIGVGAVGGVAGARPTGSVFGVGGVTAAGAADGVASGVTILRAPGVATMRDACDRVRGVGVVVAILDSPQLISGTSLDLLISGWRCG